MEHILRWVAGISAAFKKRSEQNAGPQKLLPDIATEARPESAVEETGAVAKATATTTIAAAYTADAKHREDVQVNDVSPIPPDPDQGEIKRRRELVRVLFNDFWSDRDDKPVAFAERLDQAETYLNHRLTANGELWQIDGQSRKMLGLPAGSNPRNKGNGAARPN